MVDHKQSPSDRCSAGQKPGCAFVASNRGKRTWLSVNRPRGLPGLLAACVVTLAASAPAQAQVLDAVAEADRTPFLFSPVGAGDGRGVVGIGGRALVIIPTLDVNFAYGLGSRVDLIGNFSTIGVLTVGDLGLRLRLFGDTRSGVSLGLKAAATGAFFIFGDDESFLSGGVVAGTPGVMLGIGGEDVQFSLGLDTPIFFAGGGLLRDEDGTATASTDGVAVVLRPSATIEFNIDPSMSMYVQAAAYASTEGAVLPVLAVGAAW